MDNKPKQARDFRVQGRREHSLTADDFFVRLRNAEHPKTRKGRGPLNLKHVFSLLGSNTRLINLIGKATPDFVEAVVKYLGLHYSVEWVKESRNESFVPVAAKDEGDENRDH